jgi:hypothetical protein
VLLSLLQGKPKPFLLHTPPYLFPFSAPLGAWILYQISISGDEKSLSLLYFNSIIIFLGFMLMER